MNIELWNEYESYWNHKKLLNKCKDIEVRIIEWM